MWCTHDSRFCQHQQKCREYFFFCKLVDQNENEQQNKKNKEIFIGIERETIHYQYDCWAIEFNKFQIPASINTNLESEKKKKKKNGSTYI